ncbi:DUF3379 family protein [Thiolapillus sp.]
MNCEEFRKQLLQEPDCSDAGFLAHRDGCRSCRAEWEQARKFENLLRRVIMNPADRSRERHALSVPQGSGLKIFPATLAALVLLLVGGLGGYALVQHPIPSDDLEMLVVFHVEREPGLLENGNAPDRTSVQAVLASLGFDLLAPLEGVAAAAPCWIRKGRGVHMVIREREGLVAVLLMPGEQVAGRRRFHSGRWSGMLMPKPWGSMAVLASVPEDGEAVARVLDRSIRWTGRLADRGF